MYVPSYFEEKRTEVLHDLISRNPFGILVTYCAEGLDANHLPFALDRERGPHGVLYAHVARANPVWQNMTNGDDVLVVFRAGDAYVSPNWYPSSNYHLTDREREVLIWVGRGKTSSEIAIILGLSERTVNFHCDQAMKRLDVSNRAQAVAKAVSEQLLSL